MSACPADTTPPRITPTVSGTQGNNGWFISNVTVSWTVTDPKSAVASTTGCGASTVTTDTPGITFTCTATSVGGTASQSVTVKRDATPPVVTDAGNLGTYLVDETVSITCSATDSGSGIASSTCQDIAGPAYTFQAGNNTFLATATDNAGNVGSGSTSFTVEVTADSLTNVIIQFVPDPQTAGGLIASVKAIASAPNAKAKAGQLRAFESKVDAQTGKKLTAEQAAILKRLAQSL